MVLMDRRAGAFGPHGHGGNLSSANPRHNTHFARPPVRKPLMLDACPVVDFPTDQRQASRGGRGGEKRGRRGPSSVLRVLSPFLRFLRVKPQLVRHTKTPAPITRIEAGVYLDGGRGASLPASSRS